MIITYDELKENIKDYDFYEMNCMSNFHIIRIISDLYINSSYDERPIRIGIKKDKEELLFIDKDNNLYSILILQKDQLLEGTLKMLKDQYLTLGFDLVRDINNYIILINDILLVDSNKVVY